MKKLVLCREKLKTNPILAAFIEGIVTTEEGIHWVKDSNKQEGDDFIVQNISKSTLIAACKIETPPVEMWNYSCVKVEVSYNERVSWIHPELMKLSKDELWVILFLITNNR